MLEQLQILQLSDEPEKPLNTSRLVFVAPAGEVVPDDGVLSYVSAATVYDFKDVVDRSVVLIHDKDIEVLECVAANPALFDVDMKYLVGLPDRVYSAEFDQACWNMTRIAYDAFIADVRLYAEAESAAAASSDKVHVREQAQYTRADGSVKQLVNFGTDDASGDEDIIEHFKL